MTSLEREERRKAIMNELGDYGVAGFAHVANFLVNLEDQVRVLRAENVRLEKKLQNHNHAEHGHVGLTGPARAITTEDPGDPFAAWAASWTPTDKAEYAAKQAAHEKRQRERT